MFIDQVCKVSSFAVLEKPFLRFWLATISDLELSIIGTGHYLDQWSQSCPHWYATWVVSYTVLREKRKQANRLIKNKA